jgi:hypothetical protein
VDALALQFTGVGTLAGVTTGTGTLFGSKINNPHQRQASGSNWACPRPLARPSAHVAPDDFLQIVMKRSLWWAVTVSIPAVTQTTHARCG